MKPQPRPQGQRMVRLLAAAAGTSITSFLIFITYVTLAGPWLGCVWLPAERPAIGTVFPNSPAELAGLRPGDRLISADGLPLSSPWTASYFDANLTPGVTVQLEVEHSGLKTRLSVTPVRAGLRRPDALMIWLDLLVGWFTCVLAFWIAFRRPGHLSALLAAATLIVQSVAFTGCNAHGFAAAWRVLWPGLRHLVALPAPLGWFFAPVLLLFVLEFPRRWRSWFPLCASFPAVLCGALMIYHGLYGSLAKRPAVALAAPLWLAPAAMAAFWAVLPATVCIGIAQYRRETDLNHRRRLKIILCGVLISAIGWLAETWLSADGWRWVNPSSLVAARAFCTLLNASMAISFAYAVLRHRLFDLSIIIRLGIRYALSKGLILSVAPACAILFIAGVWRQSQRPLAQVIREASNGYLILAILAVVAHLGRRHWLAKLDRRFYRSRCDGRRVLSKLISNLRNSAGRQAMAAGALDAISEALQPQWAAIAEREYGGEARCLAVLPEGRSVPLWIVGSPPAVLSRRLAKPIHVGPDATWLEDLSPEYSTHMREAGAELLAPVIEGPDSDILIILGARRSDEPYSEEDLELLTAVGHSLELAMTKPLSLVKDTSLDKEYSFGPFTLAPVSRMLRRNGEIVPIGARPFDLLVFLVERRGLVLSKDDLLRGVWPESIVEEANLAQNISFLRKILGEKAGENRYISTLSGRGYSFVATVQ